MSDIVEQLLVFGSVLLSLATFPFALFFIIKTANEFERVVILRLGKLRGKGIYGPGIYFVLPCIDDYLIVDMRTTMFKIPSEQVLTKDIVTVTINAIAYFKVTNPVEAILSVNDYYHATVILSATTLRNIIGAMDLIDVLSHKEAIAEQMKEILDLGTHDWGVLVEKIEIRDVKLPIELQRAMAVEGEATQGANARVVAAEGELQAARSLKEAADIIAQSPGALQLRFLQTLNTISAEKESTVIYPLPMNMLLINKRSCKKKHLPSTCSNSRKS